ncbi:hypothetical protein Clacol_001769 [Clathrus columnatus]|uniref:U3 small nucleolar RNA-associated protein 15 C-terminal domain-containing protein n=1 Tax=Clathrus columnatus TaxID=1419009 RepID=A0AAV5A4N4_9AGAM|nr:hypothetical protein Clacol_001769 [Clathrus columnatus]
MEYHPVVIKQHPRSVSKHNPESRYWRKFRHPVFVKEYAPVTSVHFSPARPHRYAVTAATRIQIYAPRTQRIIKTISRFKDVARSGCIRDDGKLVVAGDDSGLIQVFDINSRAILRTLDSHKQPVHVTRFSPLQHTQILSCSDDTTVNIWDMPSQSAVATFTAHTDYVRAGVVSQSNPHLVLTGSYDSTVRLFDSRTGECEMIMGRGSTSSSVPVEQVLMFPSGSVALSSSGPILRVWDIVAGGRCLRALSNHQKTITALTFDSKSTRLLTGSLDQMVKVYDVSTYKVVHTMRYPSSILCLGISPDDTHIAAGMSDGTLSVRRRDPKASEAVSTDMAISAEALQSGPFESFLGGVLSTIGERRLPKNIKGKSKLLDNVDEFRVESRRKKRLREYDRLLKSFKYGAALDSVLSKQVPPTTKFSLIQELIHRDGLRPALAGRDDVLLEPILRLLLKYITDPRFGESPLIDGLLLQLRRKMDSELKFQAELAKVRGALDMILSTSVLSSVTPSSR